ncbi:MAG TPA: chloride channel protein, partial [Gemmatimonadales bacterium]|nr:chloride channel protein [Gemmatimonadales bacterium]
MSLTRTLRRALSLVPRRARGVVYAPGRMASGAWDRFVEWFNELDLSENAVLLGFAVLVGMAGAMSVVGLYKLIDLAYAIFFRWPATWMPAFGPYVTRPLITAAAMVTAWWIMRRFAPGEEGMTVPDVQRRVVRAGGRIPADTALVRTAAAAATLGGGASAGSEGPVAVLGSAAGSLLSRLFRFGADRTTLLVAAGAAAAISAAFNAPLAGAFFALEEILGGLSVAAFPVVVVASVVAAVISRAVFGNHPAFPIPIEYSYNHLWEVGLAYPLLGVIVGVVSAWFIRSYFRFAQAEVSAGRAAAGGALVGLMVAASGGLLVGTGHLAIPLDVFGTMVWWMIALLAVGKIVATGLTLGWGGSGGVFTPSLYVGAATGGAFGAGVLALFPSATMQPAAYGIVGMGATVAAATGAPITGILMVFEMTDDYAIMLPLMLTTAIAMVVTRRLQPDNLYSGWLRRRGINLEHGVDRDLLAGLTVADAIDRSAIVVQAGDPVDGLIRRFAFADQTVYPVVDERRRLLGVVTLRSLGLLAQGEQPPDPGLTARDVAAPTEALTLDVTLLEVVRRLGAQGIAALPVVDAPSSRVLGTIGRAGILARYGRA